MSDLPVPPATPVGPDPRWSRAAGLAGTVLVAGAILMLGHSSRAVHREVLGRWSWSYVRLVVAMVLWGAWWCGGFRPGSRWAAMAGRSLRATVEFAALGLFTFGVLEGVCRIAERPLSRYIGGPTQLRNYQRLVQLNSHGLRDPERPLAKPPGTWRLLMLGDSFMFGNGIPADSTCARQLERMLTRPGGPRVEVINAAHQGANTIQEHAMLDSLGLRFQPDLVLLCYVLNDPETGSQTYPALLPSEIGNRMLWSRALYVTRAAAYYVMLAMGRLPRQDDYIRGLFEPHSANWQAHVEALRGIVADSRAAGLEVLAAVWPLPGPVHGFSPYPYAAIQAQAVHTLETAGAIPLDLLPVFSGDRYSEFALSSWDPHPNPAANRRAAFAIRAQIDALSLGPGAIGGEGGTRPAPGAPRR